MLFRSRRGDSGLCEIESVSSSDVPFDLAFNINYLMDAVGTIRATKEDVVIGYATTANAITVRPKGKEYPLIVVMPLRV